MEQIKGKFTKEQANDLSKFLQLEEPIEIEIYRGDIIEEVINPEAKDFDHLQEVVLKILEELLTEFKNMTSNNENPSKDVIKLYIEEINDDDLLGSLEYEMMQGILEQSETNDELDMAEEVYEPKQRYNLHSSTIINNEVFDKILKDLEYFRTMFADEIYDAIRIKPSNELTSYDRKDSIFYNLYNNGLEEYTLYSESLEKVVNKEDKGPVLGKRKQN